MYEEIRPLQLKELQILKEFKRICEKNNLKYFIVGGTLLGCIRHKGFIPWDDDVDVYMDYKDYVALDKACQRDLQEEYFLQSAETDPESHLTYKKLRLNNTTLIHEDYVHKDMNHGISIDIYPFFHAADNFIARKKQTACAILYLLLVENEPPQHHGRILKYGSAVLLHLLKGRIGRKLKTYCFKEMTKYENIDTKYMATFYGNITLCRRIYSSKYFEGTIQRQFEDELFSIPAHYDDFLTFWYGDYMTLPSLEEQRVKLDRLVKIDTENSYLKYKGIYYCKE